MLIFSSPSQSAATLEAESGYAMESPQVSQFRRYILTGLWAKADSLLPSLFPDNNDHLCVTEYSFSSHTHTPTYIVIGCPFSHKSTKVSRTFRGQKDHRRSPRPQKRTRPHQHRNRTPPYPLKVFLPPFLASAFHAHLISFLMCSDPQQLRQRSGWDGASGSSRAQLLADLQCLSTFFQ